VKNGYHGFGLCVDFILSFSNNLSLKYFATQVAAKFLGLMNGSCIRLRPEFKNHVWSYDFVSEQTHDGRKIKILNIIDEYTRECLASHVARRIRSKDVILNLADLCLKHGIPKHVRSDNGPEFIAKN
jgi:putative transposase